MAKPALLTGANAASLLHHNHHIRHVPASRLAYDDLGQSTRARVRDKTARVCKLKVPDSYYAVGTLTLQGYPHIGGSPVTAAQIWSDFAVEASQAAQGPVQWTFRHMYPCQAHVQPSCSEGGRV